MRPPDNNNIVVVTLTTAEPVHKCRAHKRILRPATRPSDGGANVKSTGAKVSDVPTQASDGRKKKKNGRRENYPTVARDTVISVCDVSKPVRRGIFFRLSSLRRRSWPTELPPPPPPLLSRSLSSLLIAGRHGCRSLHRTVAVVVALRRRRPRPYGSPSTTTVYAIPSDQSDRLCRRVRSRRVFRVSLICTVLSLSPSVHKVLLLLFIYFYYPLLF